MISRLRARIERSSPPAGPLRRIANGTLVSAVGTGAWYTSWAIFLTRSVGLGPTQVGVGMTIAGIVGVVASTPIGWLSDRVGARETFGVLLLAQAASSLAYAEVHSMAVFVPVTCLAQIAGSSTGGPRNALVLALSSDRDKLEVLGQLRAISHIGWALGAVAGGAVISIDTRSAYLALIGLNGGSYLIYALLVARIPRQPAGRTTTGRQRRMTVLRDRPYVSLAALMGVLALCWAMLSTGLPLWVTLHTHAPRAISAMIVLVSALAIAALQVRTSRGLTSPSAAARGAVVGGLALAASCLLFALTAGGSGWPVVALMLLAAGLHISGELLFVAASWGLSVPLMPADAPGEYQGVFATGEAVALMAAPVLMTTLIANWGQPGWIVLAVIFLVPAAAVIPTARWAIRTRADGRDAAPSAAAAPRISCGQ